MNVLTQANDIVRKKWRTHGVWWKVFLVISVIILAIIALIAFVIWSVVKLAKGLAAGVSTGGNYSLYFPRRNRR